MPSPVRTATLDYGPSSRATGTAGQYHGASGSYSDQYSPVSPPVSERHEVGYLFVVRSLSPLVDPFGESGPDEPDEFDPDSVGPSVPEVPDVEPDLEETFADVDEIDDELLTAFWGAAVFLNVAIAALAIGLMLVYFRDDWGTGGGALVVGTVASIFAARFYFGYDRGRDDEDAGSTEEADP